MNLHRRLRKLEGRVDTRTAEPAPVDPDDAVEEVRVMLATQGVELTQDVERVVRGWAADPSGWEDEAAGEWIRRLVAALPSGPREDEDGEIRRPASSKEDPEGPDAPTRPVHAEDSIGGPGTASETDQAGGGERGGRIAERDRNTEEIEHDPTAPLRRRPWCL